ncbi:MAG: hypothetical protein OQK82_08285 [Candidatus Pacearchaeota archaeon]|nr:hypothetical protein [Candidatus Pacearchaeota archaeon]
MNILIQSFLQWEMGVLALIILVGSILHFKFNWFPSFRLNEEEKKTNSNRINFMVLAFAISFLIWILYDSSKIIFQGIDNNLRIGVLMIGLIGYFILLICSFANMHNSKGNKIIAVFVWFLFIIHFLSNHIGDFYGDLATLALGISAFLIPILIKKKWKNMNLKFYITILVMLFVFWGGLLLIDNLYGNQDKNIDLLLNINGNSSNRYFGNGTITCSNPYTDIYVNSSVTCSVYPNSEIISANITFVSVIGNFEKIPLDNMTFVLPYEISSISFELGLIKNNETYYVTTSNDYKNIFTSYKDSIERDEKFMLYLFVLLGIVFFSIPSMMEKFFEMARSR